RLPPPPRRVFGLGVALKLTRHRGLSPLGRDAEPPRRGCGAAAGLHAALATWIASMERPSGGRGWQHPTHDSKSGDKLADVPARPFRPRPWADMTGG